MKRILKNRRVTKSDIAIFHRQLATLISAGIPIINACSILETSEHQTLATLINRIRNDLLSGKTFSTSLQRYPQHFDSLVYQLVLISEHTGKLDTMLQMVAEHLERKIVFRDQLLRALFYPCTIAIFGLIIMLIMLIFIVPRFAELFNNFPNSLPILSRSIFTLSVVMRQDGWIALPAFSLITFLVLRKSPAVLLRKLPLIKHLIRQIELARFTRNLGITLNAGIPIANAISLAARPSSDPLLTNTFHQLSRLIRSGLQLHRAMQGFPIFPSVLIQMTQTGEESGQLDAMLIKTADLLDADIKRLLERFSQLLEPLIMVILGVLIGGLVIGMYLPIFKLGSII